MRATSPSRVIRRLAIATLLAWRGASSAQAQSAATYPSVLTYRTVRVADGVYAFITPEERTGFQSGNSIAIIGDDGVLVFDTGNIPGPLAAQIAEIRKLTDKPVRYVVNSHWHPDHNLGNSEYRAAFPGVTIIGTSARAPASSSACRRTSDKCGASRLPTRSCGCDCRRDACATAAGCRTM